VGAHIIGVVPANVALETATTAIAVVEYLDDWPTLDLPRRHAIREVIDVQILPVALSIHELAEKVAELAAPLGPDSRVVVNRASSHDAGRVWADAFTEGKFAAKPLVVTIGGDSLAADPDGLYKVGEGELVQALRELVLTQGFTILPEASRAVNAILKSATSVEPALTEAGKLKFPNRHKNGGPLFALALALYRQFHPSHGGRRYIARQVGKTFESFAEADARHGQMARG
jgi:hypothetical protein